MPQQLLAADNVDRLGGGVALDLLSGERRIGHHGHYMDSKVNRMAEDLSQAPHQPGGWDEVKRRFEIEFFARANGITKRQTVELMKKYGDDYETLVNEARWLRD